jgi:exopolysaccharide biosynthesis WecB/TagA/CpsF family protein
MDSLCHGEKSGWNQRRMDELGPHRSQFVWFSANLSCAISQDSFVAKTSRVRKVSTPDTLNRMRQRFKGKAAGFYSPPFVAGEFSQQEKCLQLKMIETLKPDFIWVGLGAPKKEYYPTEMSAKRGRGVWLGVGAAFDFYGGPKPRVPRWMQGVGLEWAFRVVVEPRRLGPRYFKTNPAFVKLALQELLRTEYSSTPDFPVE